MFLFEMTRSHDEVWCLTLPRNLVRSWEFNRKKREGFPVQLGIQFFPQKMLFFLMEKNFWCLKMLQYHSQSRVEGCQAYGVQVQMFLLSVERCKVLNSLPFLNSASLVCNSTQWKITAEKKIKNFCVLDNTMQKKKSSMPCFGKFALWQMSLSHCTAHYLEVECVCFLVYRLSYFW